MNRWLAGLMCIASWAQAGPGEGQIPLSPKRLQPPARTLPDGWIEAVGEAQLAHITPDEAKARALRAAREEAIAYALGIDITSLDYLALEEGEDFHEGFLSFSRQTSAGRIVAERAVEWDTFEIRRDPLPVMVYRARIQVQVERQEGRPDPDFAVTVSLNKERFTAGEAMELAITATRPCHLTVLNVTAVDTVVVILPHQYRPTSFVQPGDTLRVPDAEEQAMGISYQVMVPEGRRRAEEWIKVIALKRERTLGSAWRKSGMYNRVPTRKAALEQLMRWLVQIPREEWTEADAAYTVQTAAP